jgi:hypothetical protein
MGLLGDIVRGVGGEIKSGAKVGISSMAKGIKTDNKVSKIQTDVKRPVSIGKVTPFGVLGQVIRGSKVPEGAGTKANIIGRENWRDSWKKAQEKPKSVAPVDTSIFAKKANWKRDELAREIIKRLGVTGADKDFRNRVFKYLRRIPRITDSKKQKEQLVEKIIGTVKGPIGQMVSKRKVVPFILERKKHQASIRKEGYKKDWRGQQEEKLWLEEYDSLIKGKKK